MFHDTLPGSSIRLAVEDYDATFRKIREIGLELFNSAQVALEGSQKSEEPVVLNTLCGFPRREVVPLLNGELRVADVSPHQLCGKLGQYKPTRGVTGEFRKWANVCLLNLVHVSGQDQ